MKKKLALLILFIGSIFGAFACKTVPYKNMKISTPQIYGYFETIDGEQSEFFEINDVNSFEKSQGQTLGWKNIDDVVNLEIAQISINGMPEYRYDAKTIKVVVSDTDSKTDLGIDISGGEGFVSTKIKYLDGGVTEITVQPVSPLKTGKVTLTATTKEGNKSYNIDLNIDLKLNSFSFKENALKAIANGGQIDLKNIDDFIEFYPANTTQKNIKFDISVPENGMQNVNGTTYTYDHYMGDGKYGKYASIIDNHILKTYKTYTDGQYKNEAMDYPITNVSVGSSQTIATKVVTLSATFTPKSGSRAPIVEYCDIEVVDECTSVDVKMNSQTNINGEISLTPDVNGVYEIVLLDPNFKEGMLGVDSSYYIRRQLRFDLSPEVEGEYNPQDYEITSDTILETDNQPVVLSSIALNSDYVVQAQSKGVYTHRFTIRHIKYPGLFDRDVLVKFIVKSIPTKIGLNDEEIVLNTMGDKVYTIYDYYPSWSYGTRFKVQLNSDFKYFVYFDGENDTEIFDAVNLYKSDGSLQRFGLISESTNGGMDIVSATGEGECSRFRNESFYLSHALTTLPDIDIGLNVGVDFSMIADSYSEELAQEFYTSVLTFPFRIRFENGIRKIAFTNAEYHVDLTNDAFVVGSETDGIKLFELPQGQTRESAIASITYNEDLVSIYSTVDEDTRIASFYLKANANLIVDKTVVRVTANNGVSNSAVVHTYIPTAYYRVTPETPQLPLSVEINKYSSAYLYHLNGNVLDEEGNLKVEDIKEMKDTNGVYNDFVLSDNTGIEWGRYNSVGTLYLINNAQQEIRFYDYRLGYTDDDYFDRQIFPIDITNNVKVSFNYNNYVSYRNGVLTTNDRVTLSLTSPIIMTIKYIGAHDELDAQGQVVLDDNGNPTYVLYEEVHTIDIYIYDPLEGVEVTTSKQVEIYMRDTLSYYDQALSEGVIKSTFVPDKINLGSQWNEIFLDGEGGEENPVNSTINMKGSLGVPVELLYDFETTLQNVIMKDDGSQLIVYSDSGAEHYELHYMDLFEAQWESYECYVVARLHDNLKSWIDEYYGGRTDAFLKNIFTNDITLTIYVSIRQFGKLQNINSVNFTAKYANKIGGIRIDADSDGVYFEVRNGQSRPESITLNYTIDTAEVANRNIRLYNFDTSSYHATVRVNSLGNGGTITIVPTNVCGENYLTIVPEDNIKNITDSGVVYYNLNLVKTIRVKVADGSEAYPFEIRNTEEYAQMLRDIDNNQLYYYIVTRDINLSPLNNSYRNGSAIKDIPHGDGVGYFSLSGRLDYYNHDGVLSTRYSSLYNLNINMTMNIPKSNIGLFGSFGSNVTIKYLGVANASIRVTIPTAYNSDLSVGILVGSSENATIIGCKVSGSIRINSETTTIYSSKARIGGMIGYSKGTTIKGLPGDYENGVVTTGNNVNCSLELNGLLGATQVYAGGLVGYADGTYIGNINDNSQGIQILSVIATSNILSAHLGGVVGGMVGGYICDAKVYPTMNISSMLDHGANAIIAGGIVGKMENARISSSIVYFVNIGEEYDWNKKANIQINVNNNTTTFGGLVGQMLNGDNLATIEYSYVRSFYNSIISNTYAGNIVANITSVDSAVGGLVGNVQSGTITSSYFNADILTRNNVSVGMLASKFSGKIYSSYAIGKLYTFSGISNDNELMNLAVVGAKVQGMGVISGLTFGNNNNVQYSGIYESYAIINENDYYILNSGNVEYFEGTTIGNTKTWFKEELGFAITDGGSTEPYQFVSDIENPANNSRWFINDNANKVIYLGNSKPFPIILKGTKALYDLIPTGMSTQINERPTLFDLTYAGTTQVMMYLNSDADGNTVKALYEISVDKANPAIKIKLNGTTIITEYIRIDLNDSIEISEDSDGNIIKINGSRIEPQSEGVAIITVRSYLDKTIKCEILVQVVKGITDFEIKDTDNNALRYATTNFTGSAATVWVDETSYYTLSTINKIDGFYYPSNQDVGYIVEILDVTDPGDPSIKNAKIKLNNKNQYCFDSDAPTNNVFRLNASNITMSGCDVGLFKLKFTPFAVLSPDINYTSTYYDVNGGMVYFSGIKVLDISHEYLFRSASRAMSIETNIPNVELTTRNTSRINIAFETSNLVFTESAEPNIKMISLIQIGNNEYEGISFLGNTFTFENVAFVENGGRYYADENSVLVNNSLIKDFEYELINVSFRTISIEKTNTNIETRLNTYKVSFDIDISFDKEYYRQNADRFDLNNANYDVVFTPNSNPSLGATCRVDIRPAELTGIFANYYSRGEKLLTEGTGDAYDMTEIEGMYIVPGRTGILKLTLGEEFNDSSYITITTSNDNMNYLQMTQLYGIISSNDELGDLGEVNSYGLYEYATRLNYPNTYGLQLSKMSINYLDRSYFNNTYYVQIDLSRDYGDLNTITFIVSSYTRGLNNVNTLKLDKRFTYRIAEIPMLNVTIANDNYVDMSVGTERPLEFKYRGVNSDLSYSIAFDGIVNEDISDYVYIIDDEGNRTYNTLSIDYIMSGRLYYIRLDVSVVFNDNNLFFDRLGHLITIIFSVEEYVYGRLEHATSKLEINPVEFEIEDVVICGASNGELTILHGERKNFTVKIIYKDIVIGDAELLTKYNQYLNIYFGYQSEELGRIEALEYRLANTSVKDETGNNLVVRANYLNGYIDEDNYSLIIDGMHNGIRVSDDSMSVYGKNNRRLEFEFKYFKGVVLSNNTRIRLETHYYYDNNGRIVIGFGDEKYNYPITKDLTIIVKDNSRYDHPIPIENQLDLQRYSTSQGGNFILLNNIDLYDWVPQDATFDSLDGNGYKITLHSLKLEGLRSGDVNIGIFKTTSETTLLKNIIVDVSPMLIDSVEMLNNISVSENAVANAYSYPADIDLSLVAKVNFGILVGSNAGAITNARIINTAIPESNNARIYFHVVTTQGYINNALAQSNIGGIAGVNTETGAITNSYVGLNISTTTTGESGASATIQMISSPSKLEYNNTNDSLFAVNTYPFVLAGGNNLAGITAVNDGIISNTYNKGMGLYNTFPYSEDAKTGGLVATNTGKLTSCYVEGSEIQNYRALDNAYRIEAIGTIGGLVHTNTGIIENAYSNAYLETQSTFIGGFVYSNSGIIHNAYSTAVNRNSLATGQFTGVKRSVLQNTGTYENCYYLVDSSQNELSNADEDAVAIVGNMHGNNESNFDIKKTWSGFSFSNDVNPEAIWTIGKGRTPYIATTFIDTISFRLLTDVEVLENSESNETTIQENASASLYSYEYNGLYGLGSMHNPLIIDTAKHFMTYIIIESSDYGYGNNSRKIFGLGDGSGSVLYSGVNYVRIVNNLDFSKIITSNTVTQDNAYLYETVFAGNLDGNGMTFRSLNINTDTTNLKNFGLFAQIGLPSTADSKNNLIYGMQLPVSSEKTVIKNLSLELNSYKSNGNNRSGVLAGTIVNTNIINVSINGNGNKVSGLNMAGALAGLIYADESSSVSLIDITVEDIEAEATYGSLGGAITAFTGVEDELYTKFSITSTITGTTKLDAQFASLYDGITKLVKDNMDNTPNVSYAGAVAGVILANNYKTALAIKNNTIEYRTDADSNTIDNITVQGGITISTADNAGGLFGYIGENTHVKNSRFVVSDSGQLLKAYNNVGGIVGENHGIIEKCSVAYADDAQKELDDTILSTTDDRVSGTVTLFDADTDTPYYVVSIGGIAGYSSRGVIIDCMSKVNVVKPLSYIAGGVIGHASNYNYIGYTYTTGAVYGKNITGGVIGLHNAENISNDLSDVLYMEKVFALNNWNLVSDSFDYRNAITKSLYDNQKLLYKNEASGVEITYDNFYIKMPEIGNDAGEVQVDNPADSSANTLKNYYNHNHNTTYVGSVVGEYLVTTGGVCQTYMDDVNRTMFKYDVLGVGADDALSVSYFASQSKAVVSTTLGFMSTTGNSETYTRVDNYTTSTFDLDIGEDNSVTLYSYRVAYTGENELNAYEFNMSDTTKYLDKLAFTKRFTTQEYIEQVLGDYYFVNENNTRTRNLFKNVFNINRSDGGVGDDVDTMYHSSIDEYNETPNKVWTTKDVLPRYSSEVDNAIAEIRNLEELKQALNSSAEGKIYYVKPDVANYTISYTISDVEKFVMYNNVINSRYIGEIKDGVKPTLNFVIEDSNKFATLFNMLNGASFDSINFVFTFSQTTNNILGSHKLSDGFGLLANVMNSTTIQDCEFKLVFSNSIIFDSKDSGNPNSIVEFKPNSAGLVFGSINNCVIKNTKFEITIPSLEVTNNSINNFGMFAGSVNNSTIKDNQFKLNNNVAITISDDTTAGVNTIEQNIGGIIGYARGLRYSNNDFTSNTFNVTINDNSTNRVNKNIGALIGTLYNSTMLGVNETINFEYNGNGLNSLNSSALIGVSKGSILDNINIEGSAQVANYDPQAAIDNICYGSIVGSDLSDTMLSNSGSNVTTQIACYAFNVSAGGLIGKTVKSGKLLNSTYNNGKITVNNGQTGIASTENTPGKSVNTYVGGLIGYVTTSLDIDGVFNTGDIYINYADNALNRICVGGLVGYSTGYVVMNNFASIGDIMMSTEFENTIAYLSGVLGLNSRTFTGTYGYSYTEFKKHDVGDDYFRYSFTHTVTSAITNNSITSSTNNVYYAQEFVGNNYDRADYLFETFAIGDLYNCISSDSAIYRLIDENYKPVDEKGNLKEDYTTPMSSHRTGNIYLPLPKAIESKCKTYSSEGNSKFNVKTTNQIDSNYYNVIFNDTSNDTSLSINNVKAHTIVSGRTGAYGKSIITGGNTAFGIISSDAVVSNLYIKNNSLSTTNNGLITHCYVYGTTETNILLSTTNNGTIYASATAVEYLPNVGGLTMTGLVKTNKGVISDCYSISFPYSASTNEKTKVNGLVNDNTDGTIQNSYYYIVPEAMDCVSEHAIILENNYKGTISKTVVANTPVPGFVASRRAIWSEGFDEKIGNTQLKGFKNTSDSGVVMTIKLKLKDNSVVTYDAGKDVSNMKDDITAKSGLAETDATDYQLDFYKNSFEKPIYRVVKITTGDQFITYFSSLRGDIVPVNTIVLLVGEINVDDISRLHPFSIPDGSAIIGINAIVSFKDGDNNAEFSEEIINANYGMILNVTFKDFTIRGNYSMNGLAPIRKNNGVIANVQFTNFKVISNGAYGGIAGFIYANGSDGCMYGCKIHFYDIVGSGSANWICYRNNNSSCTITNGVTIGTGSKSGRQYTDFGGY